MAHLFSTLPGILIFPALRYTVTAAQSAQCVCPLRRAFLVCTCCAQRDDSFRSGQLPWATLRLNSFDLGFAKQDLLASPGYWASGGVRVLSMGSLGAEETRTEPARALLCRGVHKPVSAHM